MSRLAMKEQISVRDDFGVLVEGCSESDELKLGHSITDLFAGCGGGRTSECGAGHCSAPGKGITRGDRANSH